MAGAEERKPYFQGIVEHKTKGKKEKYVALYACLIGRQIYIYDDITMQNLKGMLTLDISTKIKIKEKGGHRIELTTRDVDNGVTFFRKNTFRCEAKGDRDIWYAFIHAVAKGNIPKELPLSPAVMSMIDAAKADCVKVNRGHGGRRPSVPNLYGFVAGPPRPTAMPIQPSGTNRQTPDWQETPLQHLSYGFESIDLHMSQPNQRRSSDDLEISRGVRRHEPVRSTSDKQPSRRLSPVVSSDSDEEYRIWTPTPRNSGEYDGRQTNKMGHKFFTNETMNQRTPRWFFENCSSHESELILTLGKKYGNIMMRESTGENGSYVIDTRKEKASGAVLKHTSIFRTREGNFTIDTEDAKEEFSCLNEVMDYMTNYVGGDHIKMSTNDKASIIGGANEPAPRKSTARTPVERRGPVTATRPLWRDTGYDSPDESHGDYCDMDQKSPSYEAIDELYTKPDPIEPDYDYLPDRSNETNESQIPCTVDSPADGGNDEPVY